MKQLYTLFFILFSITGAFAQYLLFNNQVPSSLSVCENEEGFVIEFKNNFGKKIRNIYVIVTFPNGVQYNGNLANNSNYPAYEYNVNNPETPWFRINQIPKNKIASFSFSSSSNLPRSICPLVID